jgi:hypothetical protein
MAEIELDGWNENDLLNQAETVIVDYLVEKFSVDYPSLRLTEIEVDEPREVTRQIRDQIGQSYDRRFTEMTIHIPFDGSQGYFECQPNQFNLNPPSAVVNNAELTLTLSELTLDAPLVTMERPARSAYDVDCPR